MAGSSTNTNQQGTSKGQSQTNTTGSTNQATTNQQNLTGSNTQNLQTNNTGTSALTGATQNTGTQNQSSVNSGLTSSLVQQLNNLQQSTLGQTGQSGSTSQSGYQNNTGSTSSAGTSATTLNPQLQAEYNQYAQALQNYYAPNGAMSVPTDPTLQGYFNAAQGALTNDSIANLNAGPVNTNINAGYTAAPITTGVTPDQMNPYINSVLSSQQKLAEQAREEQQNANNAQYANAGAFGGSAQALSNAQNQALYNQNLQASQAAALEQGYNTAQQAQLTGQQLAQQGQEFQGEMNLAGQSESGALGLQQQAQNINALAAIGQAGQLAQQLPQQNIANYGSALNKIPTTGTTATTNAGTSASGGSSGSSGSFNSSGYNNQQTTGTSGSTISSLINALQQGNVQGTTTNAGTSSQQGTTSNQGTSSLQGTNNQNVTGSGTNDITNQGQVNTTASGQTTGNTQQQTNASPFSTILAGLGGLGGLLQALKQAGMIGGQSQIPTPGNTNPTIGNQTPPIYAPAPPPSTGPGTNPPIEAPPPGSSDSTIIYGQPGAGTSTDTGGNGPGAPGDTGIGPIIYDPNTGVPIDISGGGGDASSYFNQAPDIGQFMANSNLGATGGAISPQGTFAPPASGYYGPMAAAWQAMDQHAGALGGTR